MEVSGVGRGGDLIKKRLTNEADSIVVSVERKILEDLFID